ncbi:Kcnh4 [Acrasis kona]|uniref:Kcnh4 n=1 Tax=Acrasis kona TaxID=1008807 RepID=A0AAW2YV01_9EUKA
MSELKVEHGEKRPLEGTDESDEPLKKKIKELEEKVVQLQQLNTTLTQQNQQKQNTIALLTRHNVTLLCQAQLAQQLTSQLHTQPPQPNILPQVPQPQQIKPQVPQTAVSPPPNTPVAVAGPPNGNNLAAKAKKTKKVDEVLENIVGSNDVTEASASIVETEIKKLFSKVNNGGKRGILAVHAGDGLEVVVKAIEQSLKQVETLRIRATTEFASQGIDKATQSINKCLNLLQSCTRAVVQGLLSLLDSAISQLMDGTLDDWGVEMANQLEASWKGLFEVIFLSPEIEECDSTYTGIGQLLNPASTQASLEELQNFGKNLSYFKLDNLSRMFKQMFMFMKRNNTVEWYLSFCLQIKYYKEYCAKMIELGNFKECLESILDKILTGPHAVRTGSYTDEDKTYLVEYLVLCLRNILAEDFQQRSDENTFLPPNSLYAKSLEAIMATCVNVHPKRVLFPRELIPLLLFLLELFPSNEVYVGGETGQDIRHLTFIADLLFIVVRQIVEIDNYDESIDSVKTVGRTIVLECTNTLLEKLLEIRGSEHQTRLKEIIETDPVFKRSLAQIAEKAVWIPIHKEEKDPDWKNENDFSETLQIKQDPNTEILRQSVFGHLRILLPRVASYLQQMIEHINVALNYKIENRNNQSYDVFFREMRLIGQHYFKSARERQWEDLLAKVLFIHSRKVKLKKMLKQWNTDTTQRDTRPWFEGLLDEEDENGAIEDQFAMNGNQMGYDDEEEEGNNYANMEDEEENEEED